MWCVLLLVVPGAGQAQDTTTVAWRETTRAPRFTGDRLALRIPPAAEAAHVSGTVTMEIVVRTDGRLDMGRSRVLRATHELFANMLRAGIPGWRFTPGERASVPVATRGLLEVRFLVPQPGEFPTEPLAELRHLPDGMRVDFGRETTPRDSSFRGTEAEEDSALAAAATAIVRHTLADSLNRAKCVTFEMADTGRARRLLERVAASQARVVTTTRCPRTFYTMFAEIDSLGSRVVPPPGHLDPDRIQVRDAAPWAPDMFTVRTWVSRSTVTDGYRCVARRLPGQWQARCEKVESRVSEAPGRSSPDVARDPR